MKIKNEKLRKYINENTTSTVRSRGNTVKIIDVNFSKDHQSVKANVAGSGRNRYIVNFYDLKSDTISGTCTCPFDWGSVCKHQVRVAHEIDEKWNMSIPKLKAEKSTNQKKYSANAPISLPFSAPKDCTWDWLQKHTIQRVIYQYESGYGFEIESKTIKSGLFEFLVIDRYGNHEYNIIIHKKEEKISLQCDCKATNKHLCVHQFMVLDDMFEKMPQAFLSESELNIIKSEKLKEYGFSLEDESYKEYFNFEYYQKELTAVPLKQGILKLSKYQENIDEIVEDLITGEVAKEDEAPIALIEENKSYKREIAIGFHFNNKKNRMPFFIVPMEGNLKKDRTELTTRITEITPEILVFNRDQYTDERFELLRQLVEESYDGVHKDRGIPEADQAKKLVSKLRSIIPQLQDTILYRVNMYNLYDRKISKHNLELIKEMKEQSTSLSFKVEEEKLHYVLRSYTTIEGVMYDMSKEKITCHFPFVIHNGVYYLNESMGYSRSINTFCKNPELRIPKSEFETYYNRFIQPLSKKFLVEIDHLKKEILKVPMKKRSKQLYLSEISGFILLKPIVVYDDQDVEILNDANVEYYKKGKLIQLQRDKEYEILFIKTLKTLHPQFDNQRQSFFHLTPQEFVENGWFLDAFDMLKEQNVQIFGYDKLSEMKYNKNKPSVAIQIKSDIDWFDVNVTVAFGNLEVSLKEIQKSVINKNKYVELTDGSIGILPETWLEKYSHLFRTGDLKKDTIRVSRYQLSVIDSLYDELDQEDPIFVKHKEIKNQLANFQEISKVKKPRALKATLRDYQKEGLNWLNFLNQYNFGGCLADDMGLGKTLQMIAFFKHLKDTKKPKNAHLVVLPTSLIFNWQEEIQKFCPALKVLVLTGGNRIKDSASFKKIDIVLTTYGIVMRDITYLKKYTFNYIVLDESQAIKNPNSQRFKAVRLLKSENKLVLTGTPIENNTFDLYSQMTFVNPGLLGTMAHFRKEFSTPIDKNKDSKVANELKQLINPFMLRRTKEQVAKELPEKTEQILYCSMEEEQQKLYDAFRNKYRDYVLNKIDANGLGKSKMYVLEGLTKLRQICDAPQLLNEEESYTQESIKIKELIRHVTEKTGKHKVLVFSQFVKMLELIKNELDDQNIRYEYLDGKTKNRQEKVENFQENENIRVFLISLKAGGTGLNLTAADYVYLVDPWWNPAVEAQAIDRSYRIGQTKHVMAYKMICKGTIEEKIIEHQLNKKQVSGDVIQTDESFVKSLSKETIAELFS
jgi:SNF2 family DNA or RNA helicase